MFNSKIDLFGQKWIDTVFEGRNKEYGAYELRSREARRTISAAIIGAAIFITLISAPVLFKKFEDKLGFKKSKTIDTQITVVDLLQPPPKSKVDEIAPPPPPKEIRSLTEVKKFTPPVVAPESSIEEELATQDQLKTVSAGARNVDAHEDGEIVIDEVASDVTTDQTITEDNTIYVVQGVEVPAEFPGGMDAFREYVVQGLGHVEVEVATLRLMIKFVVEKDGRLTDIQVLRDGGYPDLAKRAVRVLEKCPRWKPGVINGKSVRIAYVLPFNIQMQ